MVSGLPIGASLVVVYWKPAWNWSKATLQDKKFQSLKEWVSAFSLAIKYITLLCIHADKFSSNLSGIECPVRITFWSLTFRDGKSYSMSYVLILNRKHIPVSFIGRRIAFSALSWCKSNIYFRLMQIFWREKCILVADLSKKKSFSSRITYSVIDVNVYI